MKKWSIALLIIGIAAITTAQSDNHQKKLLFEAEAGVAMYNVASVPVTSFQLQLGSVISPALNLGLFLNGYTATGSSPHYDRSVVNYSPTPHGGRVGLFLRGNSTSQPNRSHVYAQLKGSIGYLFQPGLANTVDLDQGLEILGGLDLGFSANIGSGAYFGFYLGFELGSVDIAVEEPLSAELIRYNFGLRFQKRY